MTAFIVTLWLMSLLVTPNRQHVRSDLNLNDELRVDCTDSMNDGRRSAQESAYAPRADLDLHSSDRFIHCRSVILEPDLRPLEIDRLMHESVSFGEQISQDLKQKKWHDRSWELYVVLDSPAANQKLSFALRTRLAEAGLSIYAQSSPLSMNEALEAHSLASHCLNWPMHDHQGRIFVLRPSILSYSLLAGLCTKEGWTWL